MPLVKTVPNSEPRKARTKATKHDRRVGHRRAREPEAEAADDVGDREGEHPALGGAGAVGDGAENGGEEGDDGAGDAGGGAPERLAADRVADDGGAK